MFKKLFCIVALGSLLASSAVAIDDVLALVSNGKLTSNSLGVTKLNIDDKMQVKGGYRHSNLVTFQNSSIGNTRFSQIGVVLELSDYELRNEVSCGFGIASGCSTRSYVNQQGYRDYMSVANQNRGEYIAVTMTKTTRPGLFGVSRPTFTKGAMVVGISNRMVYKIRNATAKNGIASEALRRIGNDLSRILVTQY
ncbi:hypothetical protein [Helicobacter turcicus]|uniref:Bacteriocin n=1 Tax=Helicobacter turcicus TaxID=2867412 RepID=A0ABS7JM79_9HELI|nr:hypothetical protein [Helicobacter turcicus]MBX7490501.1 hypothetical protein [Helicobacter turcicus]MBX7545361.1 hypothetical protein [Helicobacter turcicus]